jgi:hypothetical protein
VFAVSLPESFRALRKVIEGLPSSSEEDDGDGRRLRCPDRGTSTLGLSVNILPPPAGEGDEALDRMDVLKYPSTKTFIGRVETAAFVSPPVPAAASSSFQRDESFKDVSFDTYRSYSLLALSGEVVDWREDEVDRSDRWAVDVGGGRTVNGVVKLARRKRMTSVSAIAGGGGIRGKAGDDVVDLNGMPF